MLRIIISMLIVFSMVSCKKTDSNNENFEKVVLELWSTTHQSADDAMEFNGNPYAVNLKNGERAHLFKVSFPNKGRNFINGTLLYIPSSNELCDLSDQVIDPIGVYDFDRDGVSEIMSESSALGQGYAVTINKIYHLNKCDLVVLREVESTDNEGAVGSDNPEYYSVSYIWEFRDLNGDQVEDLMETEIINDGVKHIKPVSVVNKTFFYFKNAQYLKM